jgi:ankyrin repeat protein
MSWQQQQKQALFALIKEGDLEGLRETFRVQESNGQSLATILSSRDEEGMAPFLTACKSGHLDIVVFLLKKGSSVNERSEGFAMTGLHIASQYGHVGVVNRLVELGASVNVKGYNGRRPLHLASEDGHLSVIDRLVELGASVNEKDDRGETPLHYACQGGHLEILNRLVELGASVNEKNHDGLTALHLVSRNGRVNVIDRLVELGASVNERTDSGWTPLRFACRFSNKSVMYLLRHNALNTEHSEGFGIACLFSSRGSLLAVLAYGFNQHVSDDDFQRLSDDVRDLYHVVRDMCSLQVISFSIIRMCRSI